MNFTFMLGVLFKILNKEVSKVVIGCFGTIDMRVEKYFFYKVVRKQSFEDSIIYYMTVSICQISAAIFFVQHRQKLKIPLSFPELCHFIFKAPI